ncbi:MAG: hypothetical protein HYR49_07785 [Gammaproteobacteria bacterium]|nr:hypothetical protein [Gammaproteobacteria bacterium]
MADVETDVKSDHALRSSGVTVKATKPANHILQARNIAAELSDLLRCDAAHRLGLAEAYPQAVDRTWTPEFYRRCQLAEELLAVLDEIIARAVVPDTDAGQKNAPEAKPAAKRRDFPHPVPQSRRRHRI